MTLQSSLHYYARLLPIVSVCKLLSSVSQTPEDVHLLNGAAGVVSCRKDKLSRGDNYCDAMSLLATQNGF